MGWKGGEWLREFTQLRRPVMWTTGFVCRSARIRVLLPITIRFCNETSENSRQDNREAGADSRGENTGSRPLSPSLRVSIRVRVGVRVRVRVRGRDRWRVRACKLIRHSPCRYGRMCRGESRGGVQMLGIEVRGMEGSQGVPYPTGPLTRLQPSPAARVDVSPVGN
jgi:hypothetical protein